ncbi:hypothetical protein TSUD_87540 [Trifolium subterraneum]|uniref:PPM-type phosphatase domain-containing protein n=1 Tax=Trifolium subterraneum TaxID=3900 RepID=A0A2Z6PBH7_TRISU|nr:hypothetical protein TSUD_87540 [Trifolium subterraneum]
MGNGIGKLTVCFTGKNGSNRKHDISILITDPLDEGLGHSFCYVRPDPTRLSSSKVHSEETTTFRTISGASVSANTSTPLSTAFMDLYSYGCFDRAAAFESSTSFASLPLQPIPKNLISSGSGPFSGNFGGGVGAFPSSGPLERGFMSGPIERGFMSGPIDRGLFSGPIEKENTDQFQRSFSHSGLGFSVRPRTRKEKWIRVLQRAISKTLSRGQNSIVTPIKGGVAVKEPPEWILAGEKQHNENLTVSSLNLSSEGSLEDDDSLGSQNLQWAQGKAGEDRVHVVVSEEHGWVFVGIYDGFNGPDAPDYLLSNLYTFVHKELKGLLWDDGGSPDNLNSKSRDLVDDDDVVVGNEDKVFDDCSQCVDREKVDSVTKRKKRGKNSKNKYKDAAKKHEENHRRWKCEWDRERLELDRRLKEQLSGGDGDDNSVNHSDVLEALSRALRKTEESYLDVADKMVMENPELALMGSCVLVMLMKGEDVYVMNVGDSRAVLAQKAEPDYWIGKIRQDLERINEETMHDLESWDDTDKSNVVPSLSAFQLTKDHSTNVEEEVIRIIKEHPDDPCAVVNDRVKGSLKVTRAFGAGFLKQSQSHTFTQSTQAVAEVELFITLQPEGDPAQHLVEEVLFRAAKKAGLDFHELLEIPQGDRRRYHDDVSIIVISLEGRIWRSCV